MPTDKQRAANKRNAQKSTGPRTDEGKKRSAANAIRHGLFAKDYTMTPEEKIDKERLLDAYIGHFHPQDPITLDLIEELAMAKIRQKRAWALEAALLKIEMRRQQEAHEKDYPDEDMDGRIALCVEWLADESRTLETLRRYEGQLHRAWHKCLAQLERRLPPKKEDSQSEPNFEQPQRPEPLPAPVAPIAGPVLAHAPVAPRSAAQAPALSPRLPEPVTGTTPTPYCRR